MDNIKKLENIKHILELYCTQVVNKNTSFWINKYYEEKYEMFSLIKNRTGGGSKIKLHPFRKYYLGAIIFTLKCINV